MSRLGKISFIICGLSLLILFAARLILGGWINFLYLPLGFSIISFVAAFALDFRFYTDFFTMRTTKHGMNMGTLILSAVALILLINYFSARYDKVWDLTKEGLNSLSEQSINVLNGFDEPVQIKVFYKGEEDKQARADIREAFEKYINTTNNLTIEYINAFAQPALAQDYLQADDAIKVFAVYKSKRIEISQPYNENEITSALVRVTREQSQTIYFLSGHGEKNINDEGLDGASQLRDALLANAYEIETINLLRGDALENKAGVLAILGPETALLDNEIEAVREFMKNGGKLFLAIDPGLPHQLANLTKPLGVEFKNNYLVNERVRLMNASPATVLGLNFDASSEITKNFAASDQFALFVLASELRVAPETPKEWQVNQLLKTVPSAYAINDLKKPVDPSNADRKLHTLGISVVGELVEDKEFRFVAYGDSDFITNRIIFNGVSRDLALNSFAHLIKDAGLINVTPKIPEGTQMTMTRTGQLAAVAGGVALPLALIVLGGFLWVRRKSS